MIVFSVYNIKGGVGKTAAAVNLSYLAASESTNTLICDLDPQASTTYYFRIKAKVKSGKSVLIKGRTKLDKNIKGTDFDHLDLLPADFSFRNLDLMFDKIKKSKKRLKDSLKSMRDEYEFIFLDCPPNITLVSENVFSVSDYVLVPVIPTTLSYRTYRTLITFFESRNFDKKKIIPFFSMVEKRKNLHKDTIEKMQNKYKGMLNSQIPYSSIIERMGIYREPVVKYRPKSVAAENYRLLWNEIKERIYTK